ncbi:hypothetical protein ASC94_03255 [Massilia sp. Root418]|uniref:TetR/AcrR family transcriptional regulator n=1 Tax=Massilia sp. Root418 TaxID=1736532 RepID=UPI0006F98AA4|nr:TetR/AcrR family transcriptional regulator [Massilia sp. Root418]KQX01638.1 hypothetical protein ASC94_03255 [Massilia sp. Root418]
MLDHLQDRRSQRTRAALNTAFLELLMEQGYEALKLSAVAQRANVGRSTCYEHYRTKHDLLKASIAAPFSTLADLAGDSAQDENVSVLLRHFRDNQHVARVLLAWPTRPLLGDTLAAAIALRLERHPPTLLSLPIVVLARQIADAQLSLLDSWLTGRQRFELDVAANALRLSTRALAQH